LVADCQNLHKRNELLLARQLDGIRRTLGALQKSSDDEDLYDRLGQLARRRARLFTDDA
jgi:flagellar biosynthesis/type III secretory pathway chaperone